MDFYLDHRFFQIFYFLSLSLKFFPSTSFLRYSNESSSLSVFITLLALLLLPLQIRFSGFSNWGLAMLSLKAHNDVDCSFDFPILTHSLFSVLDSFCLNILL